MCGRFAFYSPAEAAAALFGTATDASFGPRYNIAPTQQVAAIRERPADGGGRELVTLRWGLVPFWAKDPSIGSRMINARAETVAEKPAYRAAYRRRRCLVLADGFYEWRAGAGGKTPYFIRPAADGPFAFAALWEHWEDRDTGEVIQSTTLLTTAASGFMEQLHKRMPVVLHAAGADRWLAGDERLLDDWRAPSMTAWPVTTRVNNARNEGADLIEAAGDALSG